MKKFFYVAILSVGIFSGLIFSPEIWAMVEPHITITMDPGQTTKPFVINNDLGTEVFSVDVNGAVRGSTSEIFLRNDTLLTISASNTEANPLVLGKWEITKSGGIDLYSRLIEAHLIGSGKITSGTGRLNIEIQDSIDDITYSRFFEIDVDSSVFTATQSSLNPFNLFPGDTRYWRVVAYNDDGATTGEWESYQVWIELSLPPTYTMGKIG